MNSTKLRGVADLMGLLIPKPHRLKDTADHCQKLLLPPQISADTEECEAP